METLVHVIQCVPCHLIVELILANSLASPRLLSRTAPRAPLSLAQHWGEVSLSNAAAMDSPSQYEGWATECAMARHEAIETVAVLT